MTALIFTSRSIGNATPKLSASVNASFKNPIHCLEIFPMVEISSKVFTWFNKQKKKKQQQFHHLQYSQIIFIIDLTESFKLCYLN